MVLPMQQFLLSLLSEHVQQKLYQHEIAPLAIPSTPLFI